jgi:hypothetical protein
MLRPRDGMKAQSAILELTELQKAFSDMNVRYTGRNWAGVWQHWNPFPLPVAFVGQNVALACQKEGRREREASLIAQRRTSKRSPPSSKSNGLLLVVLWPSSNGASLTNFHSDLNVVNDA